MLSNPVKFHSWIPITLRIVFKYLQRTSEKQCEVLLYQSTSTRTGIRYYVHLQIDSRIATYIGKQILGKGCMRSGEKAPQAYDNQTRELNRFS